MKRQIIASLPIVSFLLLTGCGINDGNEGDTTALRNDRGTNDLQRTHYLPGDDTGDFSSSANFNYNNRINDIGLKGENHRDNWDADDTENRNLTNTNNRNNLVNDNRNQINRITVADKAAKKIAAMREVENANVFVTENNAYVAARLEENADEKRTADIKRQISDLVKSTDRKIERVYVSVNADFYHRTASYADEIRNGRPAAGLIEEFQTLVQRIFPAKQ